MLLSTVIVSYKQPDLLDNCLSSIRRYNDIADSEVLVIDNNSNLESIRLLSLRYSEIKFHFLTENIGFGKANNYAIFNYCTGKYVLLLNSDAELIEPIGRRLINYLEENLDVAAIGPCLINSDGSIQSSTHGMPSLLKEAGRLFPTLKKTYENAGFIKQVCGKLYDKFHIDLFVRYSSFGLKTLNVTEITGACLLIRNSSFVKIGGFDPHYFMYLEEADLCKKLILNNYKIVFYPSVRVVHKLFGSDTKTLLVFNKNRLDSLQFFYIKWYGKVAQIRLNIVLISILCVQLPLDLIISIFSKNRQRNIEHKLSLLTFLFLRLKKTLFNKHDCLC